jgi:hypothetical protein
MNSSRVSKFGLRPTLVSSRTQSRLAHEFSLVPARPAAHPSPAHRGQPSPSWRSCCGGRLYLTYGRDPQVGPKEGSGLHADGAPTPPLPFAAGHEPAGIVEEHQKSTYFAMYDLVSGATFVFARVNRSSPRIGSYLPSGRWLRCRTDYPGSRRRAWTVLPSSASLFR